METLSRFLSFSLRFKILFGLLLSLVPMLAIVGVSYYSARATALTDSEEIMKLTSQHGAKEINGFIKAQESVFLDWTKEDLFGLAIEFKTTEELRDHFESMLIGQEGFALLMLTDKEGKVLEAASGKGKTGAGAEALKGRRVKEASGLINKAGRSAILVESDLTKQLGQPATFLFSFRAMDSQGKPNGLFLAYLNLSNPQSTVRAVVNEMQTSGFHNAAVGILDMASTMVLGHSDEKMIGSRLKMEDELKSWLMGNESGEARKFDLGEETDYVTFAPLQNAAGLFKGDVTAQTDSNLRLVAFIPEDDIMSGVQRIAWTSIGIAAVGTTAIVLIGLFITLNITRPVNQAVAGLRDIAKGDLTVAISSEDRSDELGTLMQGFNNMLENLRGQTEQMIKGANTLATSANQISTTASQLATNASETSSSVSEITTTLEEVKQTVHVSDEKASHVAQSAEKTEKISDEGQKATADAIAGMTRIKEEMADIAEGIVQLSEQTQSIGQIIGSVNDLADQSNLLSVNASIEAAKAGEHGKGFAVVAEEVKSLADQSKEATDQVRTILNDIQKASSAAVMATERGSKAVASGVELSTKAGDTIGTLANNVTESAQAATQIAASSREQLVGMDQLAAAMDSIKDASTQNADRTKQLESQAQSLKELGHELKELAAKFKV